MVKKIKKSVWNALNAVQLGGAVQLVTQSALTENGWFRSYHTKQSVDQSGKPIPWCTYPFIHFIEPRLSRQMEVFEYGCGNSTIWYAARVKSIRSVEHEEQWVQIVRPKLPGNASVIFRALSDQQEYPAEVKAEGKPYQIIVIDGRERNRCAQYSVKNLAADGVLVFDNTNVEKYRDGLAYLDGQGFRRLDFWGMCPIASHLSCTSIFYRPGNCLGI